MRVYLDTGVFIDYLSIRGSTNAILRSADRRGRALARLASDDERLFEKLRRDHIRATSCLTYYEVEEALYRELSRSVRDVSHSDRLLIPTARSITIQMHTVIELFDISILDLTAATVRTQLQQLELQTRGIRAADALHAATAIALGADLVVSTDEALLDLDGVLVSERGNKINCRDTDRALEVLS